MTLFGFAEDLMDEYRRKGWEVEHLFLALVTLMIQDDHKKAAKALCLLDDVVMRAVSLSHE